MIYLLFGLIAIVILLFITANNQANTYSMNKFENFTLSSVGNIRDKIKSPIRSKIISTIKHKMKNTKEIEDVQLVDNADIYQYLD
jgi:phage-related protein